MARAGQGDRNQRAQARLRELGHDPGPLRGAEYRLRVAMGRARGLSGGQAVGKPLRGEQLVSRLVQAGRLPAPQRRAARRQPRDVVMPQAGRLVTTSDMRYLTQQIREAGRRGERVAFHITATGPQGTRTRPIAGTNDQRALIHGRSAGAGTEGNHARGDRIARGGARGPGESDAEVAGKIRMAASTNPDVLGGQGFDPDELLDWLDAYDDPREAFADLWDEGYLS